MPAKHQISRNAVQPQVTQTHASPKAKAQGCESPAGNSGASADQGVSNTCEGVSSFKPTTVADLLEKLREYEQHTKIAKGFVTIKLYGDGSGFIRDSNDTELLQFDAWPEAYVWLQKTVANINA